MALVRHSDITQDAVADATVYLAVAVVEPGEVPGSVELIPLDTTVAEAGKIRGEVESWTQHAGAPALRAVVGRDSSTLRYATGRTSVPAPRRSPERTAQPTAKAATGPYDRGQPARDRADAHMATLSAEEQKDIRLAARRWAQEQGRPVQERGQTPAVWIAEYVVTQVLDAKPAKPAKAAPPPVASPFTPPK